MRSAQPERTKPKPRQAKNTTKEPSATGLPPAQGKANSCVAGMVKLKRDNARGACGQAKLPARCDFPGFAFLTLCTGARKERKTINQRFVGTRKLETKAGRNANTLPSLPNPVAPLGQFSICPIELHAQHHGDPNVEQSIGLEGHSPRERHVGPIVNHASYQIRSFKLVLS